MRKGLLFGALVALAAVGALAASTVYTPLTALKIGGGYGGSGVGGDNDGATIDENGDFYTNGTITADGGVVGVSAGMQGGDTLSGGVTATLEEDGDTPVTVNNDGHSHTKATLPALEAMGTAGASGTAPVVTSANTTTMTNIATQTELDSGLAGKQDASTAATDAELAAGLALKQDASTAATDTELSTGLAGKANTAHSHLKAEVPNLESHNTAGATGTAPVVTGANAVTMTNIATQAEMDAALALKQDASTAATDSELSTGLAGKAATAHSHLDAEVADALSIVAGTINNTPIGATTRNTGAFTSLVGESVTAGTAGSLRGVLAATRGASTNTPGALKLTSKGGTDYWVWMTDAGSIRGATSLPTADTDGAALGGATAKPTYIQLIAQNITPSSTASDTPTGVSVTPCAVGTYNTANDNWVAVFDSQNDAGFFTFRLPDDFDGTVEKIIFTVLGEASTAYTWKFGLNVMSGNSGATGISGYTEHATTLTTTTAAGSYVFTDVADTTNFSGVFGTSANAGKVVKFRIRRTDAIGGIAYFVNIYFKC